MKDAADEQEEMEWVSVARPPFNRWECFFSLSFFLFFLTDWKLFPGWNSAGNLLSILRSRSSRRTSQAPAARVTPASRMRWRRKRKKIGRTRIGGRSASGARSSERRSSEQRRPESVQVIFLSHQRTEEETWEPREGLTRSCSEEDWRKLKKKDFAERCRRTSTSAVEETK